MLRPSSLAPAIICALGIVSLANGQSAGKKEEMIQEFFFAERVYTEAKHEVQVTISADFRRSSAFSLSEIPLLIEYGITDRLQVEGDIPLYSKSNISGTSAERDITVGTLYSFLPDLDKFALTAGIALSFPRSSVDQAGEGKVRILPTVIIAKKVGQGEIHSGVSVAIGKPFETTYNVAAVYPWARWRGTLELNSVLSNKPHALLVSGGIIRQLGAGFELGVGSPVGLTKGLPHWGVVFKLTREL